MTASLASSFSRAAKHHHLSTRSSPDQDEDIIDDLETVCRPRYDCSKDERAKFRDRQRGGLLANFDLSFTGVLNHAETPVSFAALNEYPDEEEDPDRPDRPPISAVLSEGFEDNNEFISDMKSACPKDRKQYCAGQSWKGGGHTMCKFCVSSTTNLSVLLACVNAMLIWF